MHRLRVAAFALLLVAMGVACEPTEPRLTAPTDSPSVGAVSPPKLSPSPEPPRQLRTILDVEWRADGARWPTVLSVPFGGEEGELGIKTYRDRPPIIPSAFAVTDEGFWILDPEKRRLCLFDREGRLLRSVGRVSQIASDLAVDTSGQPVLIDREPEGVILRLVGSRLRPFRLGSSAFRLAQTDAGVFDVFLGDEAGQQRYLTMDATWKESLPAGDDQFRIVTRNHEGSQTVLATSEWRRLFTFARTSHVDTASFLEDITLTDGRALLRVVPGTFSSDTRQEMPLYLLEMSLSTGRVVSYVRVERGTVDATNQARHFAVHRGQVYQLTLQDTHVEIRKRPRRP